MARNTYTIQIIVAIPASLLDLLILQRFFKKKICSVGKIVPMFVEISIFSVDTKQYSLSADTGLLSKTGVAT